MFLSNYLWYFCFLFPHFYWVLKSNRNAIVFGGKYTEDSTVSNSVTRNADSIILNTSNSWCASVAGSSWWSVHILARSWEWSYEDRNLLNSALQAKSVPSNWTLFVTSLSLPLKHEAEGDFEVVDKFHASGSCLQLSNLYWRFVSNTTSIFFVMCSKFLELSEGLIYLRFRK